MCVYVDTRAEVLAVPHRRQSAAQLTVASDTHTHTHTHTDWLDYCNSLTGTAASACRQIWSHESMFSRGCAQQSCHYCYQSNCSCACDGVIGRSLRTGSPSRQTLNCFSYHITKLPSFNGQNALHLITPIAYMIIPLHAIFRA